MTFYADMASTALELLNEFGSDIVLEREAGGEINPVTGAELHGVDSTLTATGVFGKYSDSAVDGSRILYSDRRLIVSNEVVPQMGDKVTIDGSKWGIIDIDTVKPDGSTVIVYFLQMRR